MRGSLFLREQHLNADGAPREFRGRTLGILPRGGEKMGDVGKLLASALTLTFLGTTALSAEDGRDRGTHLYTRNCETCHGTLGDGNGPSAAFLNSRPADFTNPGFWQGDVDKKITDAIRKGKGEMPSFDLESHDIRAIIGYIKRYIRHPEKNGGKGRG